MLITHYGNEVDPKWLAARDRRIAKNQREAARQKGCWRSLGLGYTTGTHKPTDRCRKCGFGMTAASRREIAKQLREARG